jgi:two-component system chemotaxis response regulator CheY
MNVLIADDNAIMRKIVNTNLKVLFPDANVEEVANGKEAVSSIKHNEFNLIFLDISMPILNGFEVLDNIDLENRKFHIIIISGELSKENLDRVKSYNIRYIIEKPFDTKSFNQVMEELTKNYE